MRAGFVIQTESAEETEALGTRAGSLVPPGSLICLCGELGAGKTAFVRGLARGIFGPDTIQVTSPTYVLMHEYRAEKPQTGSLYHIDAYRLGGSADDSSGEFMGAGLGECLNQKNSWVCIEWPERVRGVLPADRIEIEIEHLGDDKREIHLLATGPKAGKIIDELVLVAGTRELLSKTPPAPPSLS